MVKMRGDVAKVQKVESARGRVSWYYLPFDREKWEGNPWRSAGRPGVFQNDCFPYGTCYRLSDDDTEKLEECFPGIKLLSPPWGLFAERVNHLRPSRSTKLLKHYLATEVLTDVTDFPSELTYIPPLPAPNTSSIIDLFATVLKYRFERLTVAAQRDALWPRHLGGAESRVAELIKSWSESVDESLESLKRRATSEAIEADLGDEICPIIIRLFDAFAERKRAAMTVTKRNLLPDELRSVLTAADDPRNDPKRTKELESDLFELEAHFDWLVESLNSKRAKANGDGEPKSPVNSKAKQKGRRGRKLGSVASDEKKDQQIMEMWRTKKFKTKQELADTLRMSFDDIKCIIDRVPKREKALEKMLNGKPCQGQ